MFHALRNSPLGSKLEMRLRRGSVTTTLPSSRTAKPSGPSGGSSVAPGEISRVVGVAPGDSAVSCLLSLLTGSRRTWVDGIVQTFCSGSGRPPGASLTRSPESRKHKMTPEGRGMYAPPFEDFGE